MQIKLKCVLQIIILKSDFYIFVCCLNKSLKTRTLVSLMRIDIKSFHIWSRPRKAAYTLSPGIFLGSRHVLKNEKDKYHIGYLLWLFFLILIFQVSFSIVRKSNQTHTLENRAELKESSQVRKIKLSSKNRGLNNFKAVVRTWATTSNYSTSAGLSMFVKPCYGTSILIKTSNNGVYLLYIRTFCWTILKHYFPSKM